MSQHPNVNIVEWNFSNDGTSYTVKKSAFAETLIRAVMGFSLLHRNLYRFYTRFFGTFSAYLD
jgi:hypothetical protein